MSLTTYPIACIGFRDLDNLDDLHFGVHEEMLYARASPAVPGAQVKRPTLSLCHLLPRSETTF